MRFLFEMFLFVMILSLAILAGTLLIWTAGIPLELQFGKSLYLSFIGIGFVIPGGMNVWIMSRGSDGEGLGERVCAGIRGFGMLLCAVAFLPPVMVVAAGFREGLWIFIIGCVFWWGSIPFEDHFTVKRMKAAGLIVDEREHISGQDDDNP